MGPPCRRMIWPAATGAAGQRAVLASCASSPLPLGGRAVGGVGRQAGPGPDVLGPLAGRLLAGDGVAAVVEADLLAAVVRRPGDPDRGPLPVVGLGDPGERHRPILPEAVPTGGRPPRHARPLADRGG